MRVYHRANLNPLLYLISFKTFKNLWIMAESNYGQQVSLFGRALKHCTFHWCFSKFSMQSKAWISSCQRGPDVFLGKKRFKQWGTLSITCCVHSTIRTFVASKDNRYNNAILQELLSSKESNFIITDYICFGKNWAVRFFAAFLWRWDWCGILCSKKR
jgi:glyceraldehyde-3-phosphate dehydrogenase (NADP+)